MNVRPGHALAALLLAGAGVAAGLYLRDQERIALTAAPSARFDVRLLEPVSCLDTLQFAVASGRARELTLELLAPAAGKSPARVLYSTTVRARTGSTPFTLAGINLGAGRYDYRLSTTGLLRGRRVIATGALAAELRRVDSSNISRTLQHNVDVVDGETVLTHSDLTLPGEGLDDGLQRTWSSTLAGREGEMGKGWTHNFDHYVRKNACGHAVVYSASSSLWFTPSAGGGGRYLPPRGYNSTVTEDKDGFVFYALNGTRYFYRHPDHGRFRLTAIEDINGNQVRLSYATREGREVLSEVLRASGEKVTFHYRSRAPLRLDRVSDSIGNVAEYYYDAQDNLSSVRNPSSEASYEYRYDSRDARGAPLLTEVMATPPAAPREHLLLAYEEGIVRYAPGQEVRYTRVHRLQDGATQPIEFRYNEGNPIVRGEDGGTRITFGEDSWLSYRYTTPYGLITTSTDEQGVTDRTAWDPEILRVLVQERGDGSVQRYRYDAYANVVEKTEDGETSYFRFFAPGAFRNPHITNRVRYELRPDGLLITYHYDDVGNLVNRTGTPAGALPPEAAAVESDASVSRM
ncbi:MAG TPA: DUF6531 domain-containing protein [Moraxellaceae bacterium]|nr:DUF6531 domain-containing protein [Moraxellaceae bacterium]